MRAVEALARTRGRRRAGIGLTACELSFARFEVLVARARRRASRPRRRSRGRCPSRRTRAGRASRAARSRRSSARAARCAFQGEWCRAASATRPAYRAPGSRGRRRRWSSSRRRRGRGEVRRACLQRGEYGSVASRDAPSRGQSESRTCSAPCGALADARQHPVGCRVATVCRTFLAWREDVTGAVQSASCSGHFGANGASQCRHLVEGRDHRMARCAIHTVNRGSTPGGARGFPQPRTTPAKKPAATHSRNHTITFRSASAASSGCVRPQASPERRRASRPAKSDSSRVAIAGVRSIRHSVMSVRYTAVAEGLRVKSSGDGSSSVLNAWKKAFTGCAKRRRRTAPSRAAASRQPTFRPDRAQRVGREALGDASVEHLDERPLQRREVSRELAQR